MKLKTKHFGVLDIDEKGIIDFPEGIPGFENTKKFVLLGSEDTESPFRWLQGVDNENLALVVIDPKTFKADYIIDVEDDEVAILEIEDPSKVIVLTIVAIPDDISKMTVNLKAPVLINTQKNRGKQIVLENSDYQIRHYVLEEMKKMGGKD